MPKTSTRSTPPAPRIVRFWRGALAPVAMLALAWALASPLAAAPGGAASASPETTPGEEILVAALEELVVAADAAGALASPQGAERAVRILGLEPELEARLVSATRPYLGRPVTKALLEDLRATVESAGQGSYVARFPRQSIGKGRIVLALAPKPEFASEAARGAEGGSPAGVVPLLRASAPAGQRSYFAGIDNQLSRRLGDERLYAGARWGGLLEPRHSLGLLIVTSPDPRRYRGGSVNNGFAFSDAWRLDLGVAGSVTEVEEGARESRGQLATVEPRLTRRFALGGRAWHEARLGAEWREYDVEVTQGTADRRLSLPGFLIQPGWALQLPDKRGQTRLDLDLDLSPGWLGNDADHRDFGARDDDYVIFRAQLSRATRVGPWGTLVFRAAAQLADQDVPSLDHYYASGQSGVRGYDENRHHGSNAWFASMEQQGPSFQPGPGWRVQPVLFFDAADFPGETTADSIAGAGGGLRISAGAHLVLRLDAAWVVGHRATQDEAGAVHFSASRRW